VEQGIVTWIRDRRCRLARRDHVLYFCHIPKTCGTTFHRMIRSRFARRRVAPIVPNHAYFTDPAIRLERYDFLGGHLFFGYHLAALVPRPVRTVVLLREPRALLLSMFKHGLEFADDPVHRHIRERCPTPERFFTDPLMEAYVANPMTRYLGHAERALTPAVIDEARRLPTADASRRLATVPGTAADDGTLLTTALGRLRECQVVGLAEQLPESLDLVARREGWPAFGPIPHLNESRDRTTPGDLAPRTLAAIDRLTMLDRELYRAARARFTEALRDAPDARHGPDRTVA
jgi:hypothetical protein